MKLHVVFFNVLIIALAQPLAADENADLLWQKVQKAMEGVNKPARPAKTREEAFENYKKALAEFDAAEAAFLRQAPSDPRRWQAALFDADATRSRKIAGLPPKGDAGAKFNEIINAPDAGPGIKADASAALVLQGAAGLEDGSSRLDEWTRVAEKHLQKFPDHPRNASIMATMRAQKAMAEFRSGPLELKFKAADGHEVDLSKMRGKVVLLDFWATWSTPCVAELPKVQKAYEKFHAQGFEVIGISLDNNRDKFDDFLKSNKMPWPQYFDNQGWKSEIPSRFGIRSVPTRWLIDKKGMLSSTNARDLLEEEVAKRLAQ